MRGRAGPLPTATELSTSGSQARPSSANLPNQSNPTILSPTNLPASSSTTSFLTTLVNGFLDHQLYEMKGGGGRNKCYPIRVDRNGTSCHTLLVTRYLSHTHVTCHGLLFDA